MSVTLVGIILAFLLQFIKLFQKKIIAQGVNNERALFRIDLAAAVILFSISIHTFIANNQCKWWNRFCAN